MLDDLLMVAATTADLIGTAADKLWDKFKNQNDEENYGDNYDEDEEE